MSGRDRAPRVLAVDMGTSGPKAAIVTTEGRVLDHAFRPTPLVLLPGGGAEQDPDAWWQAIREAVREVVGRRPDDARDIAAVGITTQWSGTVAVGEDGRHLMNAVIWMDTRGGRYVTEVARGLIDIEGFGLTKALRWIRLTGGAPAHSGKDPTGHILFIERERPEVWERTHRFLEPVDWVGMKLTGEVAASYDSITLHWVTDNRDVGDVRYHDGLLAMSGLDRGKLPDLRGPADVLGTVLPDVAEDLGIPAEASVVMGTPDVFSAAIGSGGVPDFRAHVYLGTSSWLASHVPFKKTDLINKIGAIPAAVPGRYLMVGEQETAGACLSWLKDKILYHEDELLAEEKVPDVYKIFDRIVDKVPAGSDGVVFTPWLYGERAPIDDHQVRATLVNLSLETSREHIIRAVFEGVAMNTRWLLGHADRFAGRTLDPIRLIGGGANSVPWCQMYADILGRTIERVGDPILANVRGAALHASAATGHIGFDDIADLVEVDRTFEPDRETEGTYGERFEIFKEIYSSNRKIYRRLNRG